LAEATITVNSSFLGQAEIFDTAAAAAEKAGESISGVIDAFTQAYRATGGAGNEVERFAVANKLLADSLVLSKLSTLDQASAIDTLSAALRQTYGTDLTKGTELLDKWVRVTKIANVDMAGLATGFAVLGDSADAAQINIDQLNGIIATIAETGVASGRELANTARAIVSGFQSDQARKALENIGVAFADTTGQARPFLEIMKEVSDLRKSGALDDTAFSKLTLALGGGTRRQAAYATFIENFSRVNEVAGESAKAQGDAQAALAKQLDTVQTSLTRLGNAFQELAQTLGTEGGFLGLITESVNTMTSLVKTFDSLTGILGKATPALAAFIATSLLLKSRGQGGIQQALTGYAQGFQPDEITQRLNQVSGYTPPGEKAKQFIGSNVLGSNISSGAIQGLLTAAIPAILNLTNKQDRFGGTKATADVIGGVGGGIIGSIVAGSPLIGATVGTAIAEAFVNATVARKTDIFGYAQAPTLGAPGVTTKAETADKRLEEAQNNIYKSIGGGSEAIGRIIASPEEGIGKNIVDSINDAIKDQDKGSLQRTLAQAQLQNPGVLQDLSKAGISKDFINNAFNKNQQIQFSPEYLSYLKASTQAQKDYTQALAGRAAQGGTPLDQSNPFSKQVEDNKKAFDTLISSIGQASKETLRGQRISGQVNGAEYTRRTEAIGGFDTKALQYYTALGNNVTEITGGANDATEAFKILNRVIVSGAADALPQITSVEGEIEKLVNLINNPNTSAEDFKPFGGIDAAKSQLEDLRKTFAALLEQANNQALLNGIKVPNIVGDVNKPYTSGQETLIEQGTKKRQDSFYQGFLKLPDDMYDAMKKSWEDFAVAIQDSGDEFYKTVTETDQQFRQAEIDALTKAGKLGTQDNFGIQKLDINSQQGAGLQQSIDYYSKYLSSNFPQYQQKPEDLGVIFSDYVTGVLHGDNLAIKLALEKIADINQKQLDGQYNIPEGATFWVPLTAAYYRPKNNDLTTAGGEGISGSSNTQALDQNTQALRELAVSFRGDLGYSRAAGPAADRSYDKIEEIRATRNASTVDRRYDDIESLRGNRGPEKLPGGTPGYSQGLGNVLDELKRFFQGIFSATPSYPGGHGGFGGGGEAGGGVHGVTTSAAAQQVNPQVNARLQIQLDNTTQLVVDGRVLASVISPYLAQEMVRLEASQGTITKRYVI